MRSLAPWCRGAFVLTFLFALGTSAFGEDAKADPNKADPNKAESATLIIKCDEDAELTIDGEKSTQTGGTRKFVTPPLKSGPKYYYTVSAFWEPNNYTKITRKWKVYVKPGQTVTADMTKPDPKQEDSIVIRYVPTPEKVVEAMLKLGKVGKDDVVYDLGCGDGRIPVTAVTKFGAKHAVGIDIDPERIKDSKETAKEAKVGDKVEFRQQDVFKLKDLDKATVVTLYMGYDLNTALEPRLRKLKPGTRIVSHRFLIGKWKPDHTDKMEVDGEEYLIHLWTIKGGKEAPKKEVKKDEKKKEEKKDE